MALGSRNYLKPRLLSGESRPSGKGEGRPCHPDPEIKGAGRSQKFFFGTLGLSLVLKKGARAPQAPPLDPPLFSTVRAIQPRSQGSLLPALSLAP